MAKKPVTPQVPAPAGSTPLGVNGLPGDQAGYQPPIAPFIRRGPDTEKLYRLEERVHDAIRAAAHELSQVLGHEKAQFWTHTMPEALLSVLEGYDRQAARAASTAYLQTPAARIDARTAWLKARGHA